MNEPSPAPLFAQRTAIGFGAVLLLCIIKVAAMSVADNTRKHESFSQTTAVEDRRFYVPPNPPLAVPEPVVTWQGHPVAPVSYEKNPIRDTLMTSVQRDEETGLHIYTERDKPGAFYIKIGINAYLQLKTP